MAKCKKMAMGGAPADGAPMGGAGQAVDPRMAAMLAKKRARRPGAPAAAPVGSGATPTMMKKGGACKKMARGGGVEIRGKTKGKIV